MGVESLLTGTASRNRIGACTCGPASREDSCPRRSGVDAFLFLHWLARLVGLPNGGVATDKSPGRTDNGRVVRDLKQELNISEYFETKKCALAMYWIYNLIRAVF